MSRRGGTYQSREGTEVKTGCLGSKGLVKRSDPREDSGFRCLGDRLSVERVTGRRGGGVFQGSSRVVEGGEGIVKRRGPDGYWRDGLGSVVGGEEGRRVGWGDGLLLTQDRYKRVTSRHETHFQHRRLPVESDLGSSLRTGSVTRD